jgi:hypothetical protein
MKYLVIYIENYKNETALQEVLNEKANEGWEITFISDTIVIMENISESE